MIQKYKCLECNHKMHGESKDGTSCPKCKGPIFPYGNPTTHTPTMDPLSQWKTFGLGDLTIQITIAPWIAVYSAAVADATEKAVKAGMPEALALQVYKDTVQRVLFAAVTSRVNDNEAL